MYNFLALLTGIIIALLIVINGGLTLHYGIFVATVIIHIVGSLFAFFLIKLTGKHLSILSDRPLWIYSGGVIGVLTVFFSIFAYGKISLTSIVALGLLGQTVTSLLIDWKGLFGMKRHPLKKSSFIGLSFSAIGVMFMLDHSVNTALLPVIFSFGAGITIVLSRTINAELSKHIGELQGSFINHIAGLPVSIVIAIAYVKIDLASISLISTQEIWIYSGGILGVIIVLLFNITVPNISAFRLTLLTFVGQVFTGIMIDLLTKNNYPAATFTGGLLVATGIAGNMLYEYFSDYSKKTPTILKH